jgi:hypothetical protein
MNRTRLIRLASLTLLLPALSSAAEIPPAFDGLARLSFAEIKPASRSVAPEPSAVAASAAPKTPEEVAAAYNAAPRGSYEQMDLLAAASALSGKPMSEVSAAYNAAPRGSYEQMAMLASAWALSGNPKAVQFLLILE